MTTTARVADINGWYEVPDNPLSSVGVFPYSARSIRAPGWELNPTQIYMVYCPAEQLSDPETLKSFRLTPWTNDHAMLGNPDDDGSLIPAEKKGIHGVIGEQVRYDPIERKLKGNIKLWSESLADAIDAGKRELSLGYRCRYIFESGVFEGQPYQAIQTRIRGNHVASVMAGRKGSDVAVLDQVLSFTFDAEELAPMTTPVKTKTTRRAQMMKRMGITDPAVFNAQVAALDAEVEEEGGGGEPTLSDIAGMLKQLVPVVQAVTALNPAATTATPEAEPDADDMEPMLDAAGNPVMDADGKPKMAKKNAAPGAAAATPPPAAGMDALERHIGGMRATRAAAVKLGDTGKGIVAAMDSAIGNAERDLAQLRAPNLSPTVAAMDARLKTAEATIKRFTGAPNAATMLVEVGKRDKLAKQLSGFVGTFDASEMTVDAVAKYGVEKLGIKNVVAGHEVTAVTAYMSGRTPPARDNVFALDSARDPATVSKVRAYLSGADRKKTA